MGTAILLPPLWSLYGQKELAWTGKFPREGKHPPREPPSPPEQGWTEMTTCVPWTPVRLPGQALPNQTAGEGSACYHQPTRSPSAPLEYTFNRLLKGPVMLLLRKHIGLHTAACAGRWNSRPSVSALHCELLEDSLKDASVHRVHHRARPQEVFNRCATSYLSRSLIEHLSVLDPGLSTLYHFLIESSE